MKFAFNTQCLPGLDLPAVIAQAKTWGYDGLEVVIPATGIPDGQDLRRAFAESGVTLAALGLDCGMPQAVADRPAAQKIVCQAIDAAQVCGCGLVRLLDSPLTKGHTLSSLCSQVAEWLSPLGGYAAERGVTLAVQNAHGLRTGREMWSMLELSMHPAIGTCWDLLAAMRSQERPPVSIPVLGSRIKMVRVSDADLASGAARPLGEGQVPVQEALRRLRGIGFAGWLSVNYGPGAEEVASLLQAAIAKMRDWTRPPQPTAKPKAAPKPAAKPAAPAPAAAAVSDVAPAATPAPAPAPVPAPAPEPAAAS